MHILILSPGFPTLLASQEGDFYGGSFVLTEALAYQLAGAKVTVLTPHVPGLPLKEDLKDGLKVIRFRYFFPAKWQRIRIKKQPLYTTKLLWWRIFQLPLFITIFFLRIAWLTRQIDIIHVNWTPLCLLALPYKYLFKVPVVLTYRGTDIRLLPKFLNRFIFQRVNAVLDIWGDTGIGRRTPKLFPGHYIRLPIITKTPENTFQQVNAKRKKDGKLQLVFVGRLTVQGIGALKGVNIIIPASKRLRERYQDFEVHILGDGPSRDLIERQCREFGAEKYIRLHGYVTNIFPLVLNSNAVIGGLGLNAVAQESAYAKALLIMPDTPEYNGSIWIHKKNALLYKPSDLESLAAAMAYAIEHPEECKRIALTGYETIKKYAVGIEEGGRLYIDALRQVI